MLSFAEYSIDAIRCRLSLGILPTTLYSYEYVSVDLATGTKPQIIGK